MKRRTTLPPLLAAALLAPATAQDSQQVEAVIAEVDRIAALVQEEKVGAKNAPAEAWDDVREELRQAVNARVNQADVVGLRRLGPAGARVLMEQVSSSPIGTLTRNSTDNPLVLLTRAAPERTMEVLLHDLRTRPERFWTLALARGGLPDIDLPAGHEEGTVQRELVEEILGSTVLEDSFRFRCVATLEAKGVSTVASRAYLLGRRNLWTDRNDAWTLARLLAAEDPGGFAELREHVALQLASQSTTAAAHLMTRPEPALREACARTIGKDSYLPEAARRALLAQLADDPDASVARAAIEEVDRLWGVDVSLEETLQVVRGLDRHGVPVAQFLVTIQRELEATLGVATPDDRGPLGEILRITYGSKSWLIREHLANRPFRRASTDAVLALADAAAAGAPVTEGQLTSAARATKDIMPPEARATMALDLATRELEQLPWASFLDEGCDLLRSLPPAEVGRAVVFLASRDLSGDEACKVAAKTLHCIAYKTDALTALHGAPGTSARERVLAAFALLLGGGADAGTYGAAGATLRGALGDPGERALIGDLFRSASNEGLNIYEADLDAKAAALVRLVAAWPRGESLPLGLDLRGGVPADDELQRLAMGVASNMASRPERWTFLRRSADVLVGVMAERPDLAEPAVLRAILRLGIPNPATVKFAVESQDPALRSVAVDALFVQLADMPDARIAEQILRFEDDETVVRLIGAATASGNSELIGWVDMRLKQLTRLRQAQREWSSQGGDTPTRASALAGTLALLDHEREAVRVEAIRGLGTLGAVEALPRLIELVASDSPAEAEAARATLALLRERAAAALAGDTDAPR